MHTTRDSTRAGGTSAERISDRELLASRVINGPARIVYDAWTKPELFRQWWLPKSFPITLTACELDVRVGGGYRLVFGHEGSSAEFFGRYLEVSPGSRLVWTNDESDNGQVTTVTFTESDGQTLVTVHDRFPSKEALDAEIESGSTGAMPEQLAQLDELVAGLVSPE
ncbi:MAG: SRPBCC domain-containing protein [Chloroflexota bacterium]